jgi:protein TonB
MPDFSQDRRLGIIGSLVLHGILFLGGGMAFVRPAQYGVESGTGGIEISLVAAPREGGADKTDLSQALQREEQEASKVPATEADKEWAAEEQRTASAGAAKQAAALSADKAKKGGPVGDGSSPIPGNDPTTFYSSGGAIAEGKSKHLRNPAPPYPWASLVRGEEGLVLLSVTVDKSGRAAKVELEKSSGFPMLDESSLKTVRRWKFDPAHIGMLTVESTVKVPIRFVLKDQPFAKKAAQQPAPAPVTSAS